MSKTDMALYQIAEARTILDDWLAESEGEVTPALEALLAEIDGKADEKIERVALFIRERKAHAAAVKEERDRLDAIVKRETLAAENLLAYLDRQMTALGKDRVNGVLATVAFQKNSVPSVSHVGEAKDLPTGFHRCIVTWVVDREAVLEKWKAGEALPETIHVVHGKHLRIR